MNRHHVRWPGAIFGSFFLVVAGAWTVWQTDLLSAREFNLTLSVALMIAGALGIVATFVTRSTPPSSMPHLSEVSDEEATDPQH